MVGRAARLHGEALLCLERALIPLLFVLSPSQAWTRSEQSREFFPCPIPAFLLLLLRRARFLSLSCIYLYLYLHLHLYLHLYHLYFYILFLRVSCFSC